MTTDGDGLGVRLQAHEGRLAQPVGVEHTPVARPPRAEQVTVGGHQIGRVEVDGGLHPLTIGERSREDAPDPLRAAHLLELERKGPVRELGVRQGLLQSSQEIVLPLEQLVHEDLEHAHLACVNSEPPIISPRRRFEAKDLVREQGHAALKLREDPRANHGAAAPLSNDGGPNLRWRSGT